jgi:hypothetical protein
VLDVNRLVRKNHSLLSTEAIKVWNPIWKLQLLQISDVKSDQEAK